MIDPTPDTSGRPVDLSVIIVNWNTRALLLDCLASVYATVPPGSFEVWMVDNASTDGSVAAVKAAFPQVRVIVNPRNLGFAAANNRALARMRGRYALLLNTDAVLTPGAAAALLAFMEATPAAGMACGRLLNRDGSPQNAFASFPGVLTLLCNETLLAVLLPGRYPGKRTPMAGPTRVDSCIGACLMVRRSAMKAVGVLDEDYFFFFEETDWALRMRRGGWQTWFVPAARTYHLQGQTVGHSLASRRLFYRSRYHYLKKWHPRTYRLLFGLVFGRLLTNTALNLVGFAATLGLSRGIRGRLNLYGRLVAWHLKGCRE